MRNLLLPFAWPYGAALRLRHALYNPGVVRPVRPTALIIAIGNLALGVTGRTPMLDLLLVLRTLAGMKPLTALCRGYGRTG